MNNLDMLNKVCFILVLIGGIVLGILGLIGTNLVIAIFGGLLGRLIFIIIGAAAGYLIYDRYIKKPTVI